jgi:broad-specificity NMP kinase
MSGGGGGGSGASDGAAPCCLLAACGLPGAGKSTLCAALAAHVDASSDAACVCVCFDALERSALSASGDDGRVGFDAARWKARHVASTHLCTGALA